MTTVIDQKAYLQKYLSGSAGDKKKKKKKSVKGKGFKIIDDDLDLSKLRPLDGDELDILDQGEDAPQIAGIIDERPEEIKKLEQFKTSSRWRVVNQDDGFNSNLKIEEIKKDIKEQEKENEVVFGKMYSDSEDEMQKDSVTPQKSHNEDSIAKNSNIIKNDSNSDFSPPRKREREFPSGISQLERNNKHSDLSPKKNTKHGLSQKNSSRKYRNNSDSDFSPPRRDEKDHKPQKRRNYDSDLSPPRKKDSQNDSDLSPPRKTESQNSKGRIRKQSRWGNAEEDKEFKSKRRSLSPPQKLKKSNFTNLNMSSPRKTRPDKKRNKTPDSDVSPPHKKREYNDRNYRSSASEINRKQNRKKSSDSDQSPPRKHRRERAQSSFGKQSEKDYLKSKGSSDSDLSPPRNNMRNLKNEGRSSKRSSDSPPPSNKKMAKTLEGKKAGLQDARELRTENETFRRKEDEVFSRMTDEVSGRNAQAVSRKGKRETSEERRKQREKADKQKDLDEKYKKWGKGLKQLQDQESRMQDYIHEASKPLARHKDDKDLENSLKDIERDGDPMLQYIREKKRERGELGPEKPRYKGSFPPNRFNIRPGYRWDGVDRSNGYEKKYFEQQSKRKAQEEEAYKWSTEDL